MSAGKTLDEFMVELRGNAEKFEAAWREKASENPDIYPLSIPEDNSGLWLEFFLSFMKSGQV